MSYMTFYTTSKGSRTRLKTITFGPTEDFYKALATDMGRPGDYATDSEVEEYLRDVVQQNMAFVIDSHKPKKTESKKKLVIKKKRTKPPTA